MSPNNNEPPEFVAGMQPVTAALSTIVALGMLALGSTLFWIPQSIVRVFFSCLQDAKEQELSALDLTLSRVAGGVILAQAISCLVLAIPVLNDWQSSNGKMIRGTSVDKCRTCVALQSLVGLLLVLVGLLDDRANRQEEQCGSLQGAWLLGLGSFILITACLGLMLSYWPVINHDHYSPIEETRPQTENGEDTEPLLAAASSNERESMITTEESGEYQLLEELASPADSEVEEPTSRIRGTRRLLTLAKTQVFYLYVGCAVLLVRLPFSLSIPHFVSTTLGAVSRGDFAGARSEILLLVIFGSIDAALDFWCVFLFGYANQRIVRGVRLDTFYSILRQEIGFFGQHTSGELASRLNSDCGEMGKKIVERERES
jgi:ABC-type multidrug transport system fused ATPase/permease subunit